MTKVAEFSSPLRRGARFEVPAEGWNDLRTLIEGRVSPGLEDGNNRSHLVSRWRADGGGITAHKRVFDGGGVVIEVANPATPEQAARLGAALIYAAHAGQKVSVELSPPTKYPGSYQELSRRCCQFAVSRFGCGADWPVRPSVDAEGVSVAFSGTRIVEGGWRPVTYSLGEAPSVISAGYSEVFGLPREGGEAVFANLVGAPDFGTAVGIFKEAEGADTPFDAAHAALGSLISRQPSAFNG